MNPHRELTRMAIAKIESGASDADFLEFVRSHFQLALLTEEESIRLNKLNRSKVASDRLASAGIYLFARNES